MGAGVGAAVGAAVGIAVGAAVGCAGTGVPSGSGSGVGLGVTSGVAVGLGVAVGARVGRTVAVGAAVGVGSAVARAVGVGAAVATGALSVGAGVCCVVVGVSTARSDRVRKNAPTPTITAVDSSAASHAIKGECFMGHTPSTGNLFFLLYPVFFGLTRGNFS